MDVMKITLKAFAFFRDILDKISQLEISPDEDIQALLDRLCKQHSQLRGMLFDNDGQIKQLVIILKNGRNIVYLQGLATKIEDGDIISLFPPVAGG
jgi:molybdopterin synthase sulfur carrier subunit